MTKKLIHFDWALKKLLRNKANFGILEGFISVVLNRDIIIKNLGDCESNKQSNDDKFNRVDIFAETIDKEIIIIELQIDSQIDYFQRMAYGSSKALSENMYAGKAYINVKKVYSINIVYFDLGQGADYVYHGTTEFKGLHYNDILLLSTNQRAAMKFNSVSEIFPEYYVLKVNDFNQVAKDSLDEWIYVLKNSEVPDNFKAKGLDQAKEKLDVEKLDPDDKRLYQKHLENISSAKSTIKSAIKEGLIEGLQKGEQIGLQKGEQIGLQKGEQIGLQKGEQIGLQKGEQLKAYKTALKAIRKKIPFNDISELTELPTDIIKKLQKLIEKHGSNAENFLENI